MSIEVGSLNASLTLDMSDFQAGMAEARALAAELANTLQQAFNPNIGASQMIRDIQEMAQQVSLLRAEFAELKALQESMSGADLFAAMKAHTATLSGDIANIRNEISSLSTVLYSLNDDIELIISNIHDGLAASIGPFQTNLANIEASFSTLAGSASTLVAALQPLATTGTLVDFSVPLGQLQQMLATVESIRTAIASLATMDINTGEVGDSYGSEMDTSLTNVLGTIQQILQQLALVVEAIDACTAATYAWSEALDAIHTQLGIIFQNLTATGGAIRAFPSAMQRTARNTQNFANQANKAAKNLRTVKGYALSIQGIIGGIIVSQAFYRLLDIMQRLVQGAKEFSTSMQDAAVSFNYLMKNDTTGVTGGSVLNALTNIAQSSPMSASSLVNASRQLMAMGFSAKATVPSLNILVDTAAAVGGSAEEMSDKIQHITLAFGQMIAAGKVSAQELRQLYNAGLPIYELLSKGLGISMKEAKNIGKLNVDSATAVYAILQQLQQRYAGAAKDLSRTVAGSMEVIKESLQITLARAWQPYFEKVNGILNRLADKFVAFSKITQAYGFGGLFQAIVPRELWAPLRQLIAGLIQLGRAFKDVARIIWASFGQAIAWLIRILSPVVYAISNLVRIITALARAAYTTYPAIRYLFAAVSLLVIAGVIAKLVLLLAKAVWWLTGAAAAAKAIASLVKAVAALAVAHPVTFVLLAIAAAFLAIVAASEKARAAIARFFGKAMGGVQDFMQNLNIGIDPGDIAMPEFQEPEMDDFATSLEDLVDSMDDLGDEEDEAGKKAKKLKDNLQSFDEVYRIGEDDDDSGDDDKFADLFDRLAGLGDLNYSDLFDWTGDWETDWANLTAGLDDFISDLGEGVGDVVDWMKDLIDTITGGDGPQALLDLADALSIFFAALGNLKLAGAFQIVEGIIKIIDAISDALDHGWNFDNIMQLIDGLSDVIIGFGLLTGQWKLVGFGLVIQGLHDIIEGLHDIITEGFNADAVLEIIGGIGKVIAGLGFLTGNFKLAGIGLMLDGVTKIVDQLSGIIKGFKTGDWSSVNWASLITGVVEFVAGLLLLFGILGKLKTAGSAAAAADAASEAANAAGKVGDTIKGQVSPKIMSLLKNMTAALAIIAEVCAAALIIVGTVVLMGKMFGWMADAWDLSKEEALRCVEAMIIGTTIIVAVGAAMTKLGEAGLSAVTQMAIGAAIIAEMCLMTDLFVLNLVLLGLIFQLVVTTWEPVIENINTMLIALGIGIGLIAAVGTAMGLLGSTGTAMLTQMALGAAVLGEICITADLFILNLALMGLLLQLVNDTWAPVLANLNSVLIALGIGTGLIVAVGVAMGLLGSAGTTMIVQMALGAAVLAEICVAADLFILNIALMGKELQLVLDAWQPVIDNLPTVAEAIGIGAALLVAVGVACGLLGTLGTALIAPMAIGIALLAEASVATDLFIAEIWIIGELLQKVLEAWQPVLEHGEEVATAIGIGTALLLGVGAACALLGVATVASAGLLPVAIALGTAMLVECTIAVTALIESIVTIADQITYQLMPALTRVNEILPQATEYMNNFIAFMGDFAAASASYTSAMGGLTWDSIVQGFLSLFASSPIMNLANQIQAISDDVTVLNEKLTVAVSELETCVQLLTSYNSLMSQLELLTEEGGTVELQSGMFTNLKQVGEKLVTGLIEGINSKKPEAQRTAQELGKTVVNELKTAVQQNMNAVKTVAQQSGQQLIDGMRQGIESRRSTLMNTVNAVYRQIRQAFENYFRISNWVQFGANICSGIAQGISANSGRVISQAQNLANQVRRIIQSALNMHSPSRVMMELGGFIDEGLAIGMEQKAKEVTNAAQNVADALRNSIEGMDTPTLSMDDVYFGTLEELQSWSDRFVNILADMVDQIVTMFDELGDRLANLNGGKGIEAKIGSVRAAEQLASPTTTGTQQVVAVLDENSMKQLATMAADRMYEYLAPLFASLDGDTQDRMIAYVGTLIADDTGLRELERKLKVIRLNEGRRT